MAIHSIAILSPGIMGSAFGAALKSHGHDVLTCLAGRSEATRARAARDGFRAVPDLEALVGEADLVLSIMPPENALEMAGKLADAIKASGSAPPFADCNAVAPETTVEVSRAIVEAGAAFIDGGIIGHPPGSAGLAPRLYVSGPQADLVKELDGKGIDVRLCGAEIGRASAIKMCYASVSKGTNTLHTAAMIAAEVLGVGDDVRAEFAYSQPRVFERMRAAIPTLPADSARWIREMEEIAKTFESCGVTPHFHYGARDIFALLASTPLAAETRETMDKDRTMERSVDVFVRHLPRREAAE